MLKDGVALDQHRASLGRVVVSLVISVPLAVGLGIFVGSVAGSHPLGVEPIAGFFNALSGSRGSRCGNTGSGSAG